MKVGDVLIYTKIINFDYGHRFTTNKHYRIFKVGQDFSSNKLIGWIKDDYGDNCYFTENNAENESWKYLNKERKRKLEKIYDFESGEYLCVRDDLNNVTYHFFKNLRYKITRDLPFFPKKSWIVELIDPNNNLFLSNSYSPYYERYMYALSEECIFKNFNTIKQLRKIKLEKIKKIK